MRLFEFKSGAFGTWLARVARRYGGPFLIGTVVCVASLLLYVLTYMVPSTGAAFKLFKDIEARTLDVRFRVRGPKKPDPAIVIVAIDEKSERRAGPLALPTHRLCRHPGLHAAMRRLASWHSTSTFRNRMRTRPSKPCAN